MTGQCTAVTKRRRTRCLRQGCSRHDGKWRCWEHLPERFAKPCTWRNSVPERMRGRAVFGAELTAHLGERFSTGDAALCAIESEDR